MEWRRCNAKSLRRFSSFYRKYKRTNPSLFQNWFLLSKRGFLSKIHGSYFTKLDFIKYFLNRAEKKIISIFYTVIRYNHVVVTLLKKQKLLLLCKLTNIIIIWIAFGQSQLQRIWWLESSMSYFLLENLQQFNYSSKK